MIFLFFSVCLGIPGAGVYKQRNGMPWYRALPLLPGLITEKHRIAAYRRVAQMPESIRPVLLRTMDLPIIDSWYIHADVRDRG